MSEQKFILKSDFKPAGDQDRAISELVESFNQKQNKQVLLGVTGSGKTFTIANVIEHLNKPTLVIAHNKTLAAQLYGEFKVLFPENAVEYFVSYYDYYQPEAYMPTTDTFIEKEAIINDEIDRMRHSATHSLLTRDDVIIVASVSCIYGMGSAEVYHDMVLSVNVGQEYDRDKVIRDLIEMQYERNEFDFHRGTFRVRGNIIEIYPVYENKRAIRIEWFGDEIDSISEIDPVRGGATKKLNKAGIFPSSHYVTWEEQRKNAIKLIQHELRIRLTALNENNSLLEAQRLEQRTLYDIEMMEQMGYCNGIENYSRHLTSRKEGEPPPTLLDYFPKGYLTVIDESHQTIPQMRAMFKGDRSRKTTLVEHGYRLPSALDNRPLRFDESEIRIKKVVYVSATPGDYELEQSLGVVVEQVIRPTGLIDPEIIVKPADNQVDDLLDEIKNRVKQNEKVLVTTLTKRMAEDLTDYYSGLNVRVRYMHSEIDTLERIEIIKELRENKFDVLVGINLLREGLDIPEVSLVAILDADKEGFLRSHRSLIQTVGRAARNVNGKAIMYANKITGSMRSAIDETARRREIQLEYNEKFGITPKSIKKNIRQIRDSVYEKDYFTVPAVKEDKLNYDELDFNDYIAKLESEMIEAAEKLEFEKAAELRDQISNLKKSK